MPKIVSVPKYDFSSGRSTLDMQQPKGHSLLELTAWLGDIKAALSEGLNKLTNTDCAVISGAFSRVEKTLKYDFNISVPSSLVFSKPELRIDWLYGKLKR
jgi:hypothetical protein